MKKTLEIIIVSYNSSYFLDKTLESVYKFYVPFSKHNIITTVVDNASSDDTVDLLKTKYSQVNLIKSEKNLGFSAGNNIALKQSKADYIMLLNSDTEFTEKSKNLDAVTDYIENNRNTGIVTPKLLLPSGGMDKACHRGEPGILGSLFYFFGFEKIFPKSKIFGRYHMQYMDLNSVHEVEAVSGACMIMKNDVLKKTGFFDERFFMYSEDMDLCKRVRLAGYKIVFYPETEIIHHKYKSGIKSRDRKTEKTIKKHFYNSFLLYYDKYYKNKWYYSIIRGPVKLFLNSAVLIK